MHFSICILHCNKKSTLKNKRMRLMSTTDLKCTGKKMNQEINREMERRVIKPVGNCRIYVVGIRMLTEPFFQKFLKFLNKMLGLKKTQTHKQLNCPTCIFYSFRLLLYTTEISISRSVRPFSSQAGHRAVGSCSR